MTMTNLRYTALEMMQKGQLLPCNIRDERVLNAMSHVAREKFVPDAFKATAYVDAAIPLCANRYIASPLVSARLLELAAIQPQHRVLVVGCEMGYLCAVIAQLAEQTIGVESQTELVGHARKMLNYNRVSSVDIITAPLTSGAPSYQPFDVIIIPAAVEYVTDVLFSQLRPGGKVVSMLNSSGGGFGTCGLSRYAVWQTETASSAAVKGSVVPTCYEEVSVPALPCFKRKLTFSL